MSAELFTEIVLGIFVILNGLLVYKIVPFLKEKRIWHWVTKTVDAAEMIFKDTGLGKQKKQYVLDFLKKKKVPLDEKNLDILIEAAVNSLQQIDIKK